MSQRKTGFLLSLLFKSQNHKRHDFSVATKKQVLQIQQGKCALCRGYISRWERDFDHKNGNNSNNKLSNCRAVHTRCHRKRHAKENSKNKQKISLFGWLNMPFR